MDNVKHSSKTDSFMACPGLGARAIQRLQFRCPRLIYIYIYINY